MRLTTAQQTAILTLARAHFGADCTVTLFGSRANDAGKGGDIDLFIETALGAQQAHDARVPFLIELKRRIGDRRVDLVVASPDSREQSIHRVARDQGVKIS
jgi:predicted nucleotidyltransferase